MIASVVPMEKKKRIKGREERQVVGCNETYTESVTKRTLW